VWKEERGGGLSESRAFERFIFEQVLKDYDPSDEDLDVGDLGNEDDGGCDGMFFYIGDQLIGDETTVPAGAQDVVLHLIQAKLETSFGETAVEKLESFTRDMLDFSKTVESINYLNSKAKARVNS
jgi:hypothetical protein